MGRGQVGGDRAAAVGVSAHGDPLANSQGANLEVPKQLLCSLYCLLVGSCPCLEQVRCGGFCACIEFTSGGSNNA